MDGTLLGAVRDGGFIPGSGDFDIGVLAEDSISINDDQVVARFGDLPVYWNYPGKPIINVQAWHKIGDCRYYLQDDGLIVGVILDNDTPETMLMRWYDDWRRPQPGIHAQREIYKIIFDRHDPCQL